jgi:hypothetical protein
LRQDSGRAGRACFRNLTWALRAAEAIDIMGDMAASKPGLAKLETAMGQIMVESMPSPSDYGPERVAERMVDTSVPLTWSFLLDSYGYVLFKSGDDRICRSLFSSCIQEDPQFASAYLHLAEWYLRRGRRLHARASTELPEAERRWRDVWTDFVEGARGERLVRWASEAEKLAVVCFRVTRSLEQRRRGLRWRHAGEFLTRGRAVACPPPASGPTSHCPSGPLLP